ncbi:hypothetical protein [Agrobacterium sp. CG674]
MKSICVPATQDIAIFLGISALLASLSARATKMQKAAWMEQFHLHVTYGPGTSRLHIASTERMVPWDVAAECLKRQRKGETNDDPS